MVNADEAGLAVPLLRKSRSALYRERARSWRGEAEGKSRDRRFPINPPGPFEARYPSLRD